MDKTQRVLSDIVVYTKYAKFNPVEKRRETWEEIVDRYVGMMITKYGTPNDIILWETKSALVDEFSTMGKMILHNSQYIYNKDILMSMRAAQFAGAAIEKNNARIYNCAYAPVDNPAVFSEIMFLLLGGTGIGFSVQNAHVNQLPELHMSSREQKFLIGDTIEGWADAVKALMYWAFGKRRTKPRFDFSDIRPKGARLVTAGGKAPGPEPLRRCLFEIEQILLRKSNGDKLTPIEVYDIICHIADAVLAGGIRRAALICLFSADDDEMINCKSGNWWELNPQRGRANNSAVLLRHRVTKKFFLDLWKKIENSNAGEPGVYFSNDADWGTNPCCEIALRPYQFCNLTEINAGSIKDQADYNARARAAAFFGTLQAGFTDFHYLRPIWKATTEKDALIGVGMTGICNNAIEPLNETIAAQAAMLENEKIAGLIGINKAARVTTIKPSGSTSCVVGTSSGIHAWHSKFYIRNMQCAVGDDLFNFFAEHHPKLIKVMDYDPKSAVIGIPQKAPSVATLREDENASTMLDRVFRYYDNWVTVGHRSGANTNNVSATVYMKPDEWEPIGEKLWANRHKFNGMSCLPYDGGTYRDAPFIEITEDQYNEKVGFIDDIDLTQIVEEDDNTDLAGEAACAGGACSV